MAQDLPKIVAAVAAKISHRPFESEIPKVVGGMVRIGGFCVKKWVEKSNVVVVQTSWWYIPHV
jgi:hypothetical protein